MLEIVFHKSLVIDCHFHLERKNSSTGNDYMKKYFEKDKDELCSHHQWHSTFYKRDTFLELNYETMLEEKRSYQYWISESYLERTFPRSLMNHVANLILFSSWILWVDKFEVLTKFCEATSPESIRWRSFLDVWWFRVIRRVVEIFFEISRCSFDRSFVKVQHDRFVRLVQKEFLLNDRFHVEVHHLLNWKFHLEFFSLFNEQRKMISSLTDLLNFLNRLTKFDLLIFIKIVDQCVQSNDQVEK